MLVVLGTSASVLARVPRVVSIEQFVDEPCAPCASAIDAARSLEAEFDSSRVVALVYPLSGPDASPLAAQRHAGYGSPTVPAALFDATTIVAGDVDYGESYRDALLDAFADSTVLSAGAHLFFDEATLSAKAIVTAEVAAGQSVPPSSDWVLRVLLLERLESPPRTVARAIVVEEPLRVASGGETQFDEFDFALDPAWAVQNLGGCALVQDGSAGVILQAARAEVAVSLQPIPAGPLDDRELVLFQNIPNPWSAGTKITFILPRAQVTTVRILNVSGQVVRTLTDGLRNSGYHELTWDGTDYNGRAVSGGTYIAHLASAGGSRSIKLTRTH